MRPELHLGSEREKRYACRAIHFSSACNPRRGEMAGFSPSAGRTNFIGMFSRISVPSKVHISAVV
jgi:hypothetical protein